MGLIRAHLHKSLNPKCLVIGVGNIMRGDDGFGPRVIETLKGKTSLVLMDAGMAPENLLGPIGQFSPTDIIFVDAVYLEAPVGSLHWIEPDELEHISLSTHASSLDLLYTYLKRDNPAVKMHLLGVVPAQVNLGDTMSDEVCRAVEDLVAMIIEAAPLAPDEPGLTN